MIFCWSLISARVEAAHADEDLEAGARVPCLTWSPQGDTCLDSAGRFWSIRNASNSLLRLEEGRIELDDPAEATDRVIDLELLDALPRRSP
jgi:hypothetical protein